MRYWSLRKRLLVGISACVAIVVLATIGVISFIGISNDPAPAASPTSSASPARILTAEEIQNAIVAEKVQQELERNAPAYNCPNNRNGEAKEWRDLVVCPLYVATITIRSNDANQRPEFVEAKDATGKVVIAISVHHYSGSRFNSDTQKWQPVKYWIADIKCDPSIFPAGSNARYVSDGLWTGPVGVGKCDSTEYLDADSCLAVEIYGADLTGVQPGNRLSLIKYGN